MHNKNTVISGMLICMQCIVYYVPRNVYAGLEDSVHAEIPIYEQTVSAADSIDMIVGDKQPDGVERVDDTIFTQTTKPVITRDDLYTGRTPVYQGAGRSAHVQGIPERKERIRMIDTNTAEIKPVSVPVEQTIDSTANHYPDDTLLMTSAHSISKMIIGSAAAVITGGIVAYLLIKQQQDNETLERDRIPPPPPPPEL